jgi:hypothetical protein
MPGAESGGDGKDAVDLLRDRIVEWRAGRDSADVADAAAESLEAVRARLDRARKRFPGCGVDLGEEAQALLALRDCMRISASSRRVSVLSRAAIL